MTNLGFMVLGVIVLALFASGIAPFIIPLIPKLAESQYAPQLIQAFSNTWTRGILALIGVLVVLNGK